MRKYFRPSVLPNRYYTSQEREKVETGDLQLVVRETMTVRKHKDGKKKVLHSRHRWPRGLRSVVHRLLGLWVRILPEHVGVYCKCCVLSGRGLCIGLITRPTKCLVS